MLLPGRRRFFKQAAALATTAATSLILPTKAFANDFWERPRTLYLKRAVTGEVVRATYFIDGELQTEAYKEINHVLRDVQANVTIDMSIRLLDILAGIQGWFRSFNQERLILVTSGHRTEQTNAKTEGAAKLSKHKDGGAADITIPDVPADYLAQLGLYLQGGGVGWYPSRNFVHVDDGKQRFWKG